MAKKIKKDSLVSKHDFNKMILKSQLNLTKTYFKDLLDYELEEIDNCDGSTSYKLFLKLKQK
jgi:hypothetical protein